MQDKFTNNTTIKLHYVTYEGDQPLIVLMHGLTANAHAFDGLIAAGLSPKHQVISVDLRGRGLSDKPDTGYSMQAHAADMIELLDELKQEKVILGGHSFGSFLSMYIAAHFPERVDKLILMDAGIKMHPNTREMLRPSLSRLEQSFTSFEEYLNMIQQAPYLQNAWYSEMLSYYQADVQTLENGEVKPHSKPKHIMEAIEDPLTLDWQKIVASIAHPALFIHALGSYGLEGAPPLLPYESAIETVNAIQNCEYVQVAGNHQTMLYGTGAKEIVTAIQSFVT